MALIEKLNAIGDAIRSKTGKEDGLTLEQMAEEIKTLNNDETIYLEDGRIVECVNNNVTSIRKYCFKDWVFLEKVSFPNASSIGEYGFSGCTALREINMPNLTQCAMGAFQSCTSLEKIDLPRCEGGSTQIMFSCCKNLKQVNLPLIKILYSSVFQENLSLTEIHFPSVTTLYGHVFNSCSNLKKISFDNLHTIFKEYAFLGCSSLTALILRSSSKATLSNINNLEETPIANGTGYIYVPRELLSDEDTTKDYRRATNWVAFAEQFRAIEDYPEICGGVEND